MSPRAKVRKRRSSLRHRVGGTINLGPIGTPGRARAHEEGRGHARGHGIDDESVYARVSHEFGSEFFLAVGGREIELALFNGPGRWRVSPGKLAEAGLIGTGLCVWRDREFGSDGLVECRAGAIWREAELRRVGG